MDTFDKLLQIALRQYGYVTTGDARDAGVGPSTLRKLAGRGRLEHASQGLYRIPSFEHSELSEMMEAVLWTGRRGVIGYESALIVWDVSDANPRRVNVVVPRGYNPRKVGTTRFQVWRQTFTPGDTTAHLGIPVTTLFKTIRDLSRIGTEERLLRQAREQGSRKGYLRVGERQSLEDDANG